MDRFGRAALSFGWPIALPVGLAFVAWRCGLPAAIALVVLGGLVLRDAYWTFAAAKLGLAIQYDARKRNVAERVSFAAATVMAVALVAWAIRGVAIDDGTWLQFLTSRIEWLYFGGWGITTSAILFLHRHIRIGDGQEPRLRRAETPPHAIKEPLSRRLVRWSITALAVGIASALIQFVWRLGQR